MINNLFSEKGSKTAWSISLRFCSGISASDLDEFLFSVAVPFHLYRIPAERLLACRTKVVADRVRCRFSLSEEKVSTENTDCYANSYADKAEYKSG